MKKNRHIWGITLAITGFILVGISYLIDKFATSGFLVNVNSDTFGVGLALVVTGIVLPIVTKILKNFK